MCHSEVCWVQGKRRRDIEKMESHLGEGRYDDHDDDDDASDDVGDDDGDDNLRRC